MSDAGLRDTEPREIADLDAVELFGDVRRHDLGAGVQRDEHTGDAMKMPELPVEHQHDTDAAMPPAEHPTGVAGVAHRPVLVAGSRPANGTEHTSAVERGAGQHVEHGEQPC